MSSWRAGGRKNKTEKPNISSSCFDFKKYSFCSEASLLCQCLGRKPQPHPKHGQVLGSLLKTFTHKKKVFIHKKSATTHPPPPEAKKKNPPITALNQVKNTLTPSLTSPSHNSFYADQLWCEDSWCDAVV